jgi:uncharacterized membrane protein YfcA
LSIDRYRPLLGAAIVAAGLWMALRTRGDEANGVVAPVAARAVDGAACLVAGFCGGLTSLSGPPLVLYFGHTFPRELYRRTLTRIFLAEAAARVAVYAVTGTLGGETLETAALSLPLVLAGLWVGDRVFRRLSDAWFARVVGAAVVAAGVRLIV